jgi:hypothetical protein
MKRLFLGAATALFLAVPATADVTGEYVEARSLAVHAGGCHYNGEVATAGREAVLAWKVDSGLVDGVRVDGLGVVAVVSGSDNLAQDKAPRRSVLYVDQRATPAQNAVLAKLIREKAASALGTVVAVKSAPFVFETKDKALRWRGRGRAAAPEPLPVQSLRDAHPNLVQAARAGRGGSHGRAGRGDGFQGQHAERCLEPGGDRQRLCRYLHVLTRGAGF